ncbi:hypothetical protein JCM8547_000234 [Rhodosporidiobolus lusitaniae]
MPDLDSWLLAQDWSAPAEEPIFDLPLDIEPPTPPNELTPTALILLQFSKYATVEAVEAAASFFFRQAEEAQNKTSSAGVVASRSIRGCQIGEREILGALQLLVGRGDLEVTGGKHAVRIKASEVMSVCSIFDHPLDFTPPSSPSSLTPTQLVLLQFGSHATVESVKAASDLFFRRVEEEKRKQEAEVAGRIVLPALRYSVETRDGRKEVEKPLLVEVEAEKLVVFSKEDGKVEFSVRANGISSFTFVSKTSLRGIRTFSFHITGQVSTPLRHSVSPASVIIELGVVEKSQTGSLAAGARVREWKERFGFELKSEHFYARQCAFLQSLCLNDSFALPDFSSEELAILLFAPDPAKLPRIPRDPPPIPSTVDVNQSRTIMLTTTYPTLKAHATMLGKVVEASNATHEAYKGRFADNLQLRNTYFSSSPTILIRSTKYFPPISSISKRAAVRFDAALARIVDVEDEVEKEVEGRRREKG